MVLQVVGSWQKPPRHVPCLNSRKQPCYPCLLPTGFPLGKRALVASLGAVHCLVVAAGQCPKTTLELALCYAKGPSEGGTPEPHPPSTNQPQLPRPGDRFGAPLWFAENILVMPLTVLSARKRRSADLPVQPWAISCRISSSRWLRGLYQRLGRGEVRTEAGGLSLRSSGYAVSNFSA